MHVFMASCCDTALGYSWTIRLFEQRVFLNTRLPIAFPIFLKKVHIQGANINSSSITLENALSFKKSAALAVMPRGGARARARACVC